MKSKPFEISLSGTHALKIPVHIADPFIKTGHKRVKVVTKFEGKMLTFYGALQKRTYGYCMIYGNKKSESTGRISQRLF